MYYGNFNVRVKTFGTGDTIYSSLSAWQSSGELYGGSNPGVGSVIQSPGFANTSGNLNTLADFAVTNTLGRSGGLIGADVSLVGALIVELTDGAVYQAVGSGTVYQSVGSGSVLQ